MMGALAGDIIGAVHEYEAMKNEQFILFSAKPEATDEGLSAAAGTGRRATGSLVWSMKCWKYPSLPHIYTIDDTAHAHHV